LDKIAINNFLNTANDILKDMGYVDELEFNYLDGEYILKLIMLSDSPVMLGKHLISLKDNKIKVNKSIHDKLFLISKLKDVLDQFKKDFKGNDLKVYHNRVMRREYEARDSMIDGRDFTVITKNYLLGDD
jgi:hypothetical protein